MAVPVMGAAQTGGLNRVYGLGSMFCSGDYGPKWGLGCRVSGLVLRPEIWVARDIG